MARVREGKGKEEEQIEEGAGDLDGERRPGQSEFMAGAWPLLPDLRGGRRVMASGACIRTVILMGSTRGRCRPSPAVGPGAGHLPRKETETEPERTWMGLGRAAEVVAEAGMKTGWVTGIRGVEEVS